MLMVNRSIIWLVSLLILLAFEFVFRLPVSIFWLAPLSGVLIFLTLWQLTGRNLRKQQLWLLLMSPVLFLLASWLYLAFTEGRILRHFTAVVSALFLLVFFKVVLLYLHRRHKYQAHSLENISNYLNLVTLFWLLSSLFNLKVFFAVDIVLLVPAVLIIVTALTYQLMTVSAIAWSDSWLTVVVVVLVTTEVFFATSFLPTSVYVNGLITSLVYYAMAGLGRNWLLSIREPRVIIRYSLISLVSLIIILVSAKWI